ncbi:hypothetical protein ACROYT_G011861 [Oculina patagonica]
MSRAIYLVLFLSFLVIVQLVHSAKLRKRLQGADDKTPVGKHRRARGLNWKQCSWNNLNSEVNDGKICECSFDKDWSETHLHVEYKGNMKVLTESACNRWFFTINGVECSAPVDTTVYSQGKTIFEGYCSGINKGPVKVELNVGSCTGYTRGDVHTGWNSVSRIIVEEVEPPKET